MRRRIRSGLTTPQHRLLRRAWQFDLNKPLGGIQVILAFIVNDADLTVLARDFLCRKRLVHSTDIEAHIVALAVDTYHKPNASVAAHSSRSTLLSFSSFRPIP